MSSETELERRFRLLACKITRDTLGLTISAALAWKLPHLALSAGFNFKNLVKHSKDLIALKRHLSAYGICIKKKLIIKGILEGAMTKFGTTIVYLGHDDFISMAMEANSFLKHVGDMLARFVKLKGFLLPESALQRLITADSQRTRNAIIHTTTEVAQKPTEGMQRLLGIYETRALGWNAPSGDVAKQVALVGAVEVVAGKAEDLLIEGAYDSAKKSHSPATIEDGAKKAEDAFIEAAGCMARVGGILMALQVFTAICIMRCLL